MSGAALAAIIADDTFIESWLEASSKKMFDVLIDPQTGPLTNRQTYRQKDGNTGPILLTQLLTCEVIKCYIINSNINL